MSDGRKMTSRIPVTPEVHQMYKDMAHTGSVTFDDLLRFMAEKFGNVKPDDQEAALRWGLDMKSQLKAWVEENTPEDKK